MTALSHWIFLSFVVGIPLLGCLRKVDIFNSFLMGANDGFHVAVKIIPPLVGMLVAIGMFRASGGFDLLAQFFKPFTDHFGIPSELLPLIFIRPFSGSAANGMLVELAQKFGGDSHSAQLAAIIMGSTETTFYIVALYFGCIAIRKTRYAITCGLLADAVGAAAAIVITRLMWPY